MAISHYMSDEERASQMEDDNVWGRIPRHDYSDRTRPASPEVAEEDTTEGVTPETKGVVQPELGDGSSVNPEVRKIALWGIAEARKALAAVEMAEKATGSGKNTPKENLQAS